MSSTSIGLGEFELNPATRELRRGSELIELPSSAFDGLVYLILHRERAVGRDELMAAIWGRSDVADSLLGQTLVRLRRALGDSGDTQQWIRTVPRFGYRWVGPVNAAAAAVLEQAPDGDSAAAADAAAEPAPLQAGSAADETDLAAATALPESASLLQTHAMPRRLRQHWASAVAVLALLGLLAMLHFQPRNNATKQQATTQQPTAAPAAPALVLPALVRADEEWAWLRLGLMDLVASRLRRGELATAASESVVALLRDRSETEAGPLLEASGLVGADTLRIQPEVERSQGQWLVRLRAQDQQRQLLVETHHDDAIVAAREAADTLLLRLGHLPPDRRDEAPQALTELLQRTRAAMLADQLQTALELIRRAEAPLRERPEIVLRLAQIELRAGDYLAVEQRLLALLDTVPASRDAELRGRALVTLAASYIRRERPDDAAVHYDEAIRLLQQGKAPDALGLALLGRGLVATLRGRYEQAVSDLGLARSEMESAGNALGVGQVDLNLALIEVLRLRPATALAPLIDTAARFQRVGAQEEYVFTLASIAEVQQLLLDHEAALATTERYWPPEAHSQNRRLRWKLSLVRAQALFETGRLDAAQQLVDGILAQADAELDLAVRAKTAGVQAQIAAARGEHARAARLAQAALTPALDASDRCRYLQTWTLRLRALRAQGDLVSAARETQALFAWVQQRAEPWSQTYASLARAEQEVAEQRLDSAQPLFEQALRQVDAAGAIPDDLVDVIRPYADMLVRNGQLDQARALSARIAPWADRDLRAASVFVQINSALGQTKALHLAEQRAAQLAGERPLVAIEP
ncbi:DNA-binding winged helix-turn-helix (wHTH) protein [Tahibacter aquaticus]|uniref:DNA-binding winged helix-turn-helix (WHTH) protein n=1 Tax=Tahibacter aquaticus TaxID=520092 RepID=A0A4R6YU60_9GAMM|nr:transcriptional regulator [Tahibacter aquaticus]TDR41760.1 DNA-binding winged helix-turn-helix (wHTH) protein [Tahibacter aquaticus]